ncbi:MAG: hypothetical protein JJU28_09295 [Cyclobacteriaceae bacterium]|nr:hypothetical protein [Cyclobacteriaceae bacterium]
MASYSTLNELIKSLSKSEKRSIQCHAGFKASGIYFWIYQYIARHPDNYGSLKKEFLVKFPESSLSVGMNHLFEQMLNMLSRVEKDNTPTAKIIKLIQQINVLYARGFYEECFQLNAKAIQLSKKFELFDLHLYLLRMLLMLKTTTRFYQLQESELLSLHNEIRLTLNYLQTQSQHQLQYDLLHTRRSSVKNQAVQSMDDLAMHERQIFANPRYKSFEGEKLHLMFQSEYFLAKGNSEISLRIAKSLNEHFEDHKHLIQKPALHYITHISGILQSLYQACDYNAMIPYEEKLCAYSHTEAPKSGMADYVWLHYRLQRHIMQFSIAGMDKTLPYAQKILEDPVPPYAWEYARLLTLSTAIACFLKGDKRKCLQHLQSLQDREFSINLAPVMHTAWILQILLHFENGDLDVMEARIRACVRQLRNHGNYGHLEKMFFQLLVRHGHHYQPMLKELIEKAKKTEKEHFTESPLNQSLTFFRWDLWLMKKCY